MNPEPRILGDYGGRQVEAAHRVLVDLGQVLASFTDCIVVAGGWVPDLLLPAAPEPHIGSIDVDLVLDADKLNDGRYAELLNLLLATRRYRQGGKPFQLLVDVDLGDGEPCVQVQVDFLAPAEMKLEKNRPKLLPGFRVQKLDACGAAFHAPREMSIQGLSVRGAGNTVRLRVASLSDFLVMKAHAIAGRDKPKDCYDLCYGLDHYPGGITTLAEEWKQRAGDAQVMKALAILREKFAGVDAFGPQQVVEFHNASDSETRAMQARRAYELVRELLSLC